MRLFIATSIIGLFVLPAIANAQATGIVGSVGQSSTAIPITSAIVNSTYDLTTASGTQTVSGFGFTPSACDGFGAVNNGAFGAYTVWNAHSDSALNQSSISEAASDQFVQTQFFAPGDSTASNFQTGIISAYNSGSITITWTKTGSPTGIFTESIRCFK